MSGRLPCICLLCIILVLPVFVSARTWVVHPDGTGEAPTIQAAIDSFEWQDVIELVDGVYTGPGNRDLTNNEKSIVIISQSGNPTSCVIDCEGTAADPHWGMVFYGGG